MNQPEKLVDVESVMQVLEDWPASATRHSGRSLLQHLKGTAEQLRVWNASDEVVIAGLLHSVRGTDHFPAPPEIGPSLQGVLNDLSPHTENLVELWGTIQRASLFAAALSEPEPDGSRLVQTVSGKKRKITREELGDLALIAAANAVEQNQSPETIPLVYLSLLALLPDEARRDLERNTGRFSPGVFDELVNDRERFEAEYWGKTAYFSKSGLQTERYVTAAEIEELVNEARLRVTDFRLIKSGSVVAPSRYMESSRNNKSAAIAANVDPSTAISSLISGRIDANAVNRLIQDGTTLILQGAQRYLSSLANICKQLEYEIGHRCEANIYVTPPSSQGLRLHSDPHDVFVIQCHGTKNWVVEFDSALDASLIASEQREIVLEKGDVLYMPKGTKHAASTNANFSIHVTISVATVTYRRLMTELVDQLQAENGWDTPLSPGWHLDPSAISRTTARLLEQLGEEDTRLLPSPLSSQSGLSCDAPLKIQ